MSETQESKGSAAEKQGYVRALDVEIVESRLEEIGTIDALAMLEELRERADKSRTSMRVKAKLCDLLSEIYGLQGEKMLDAGDKRCINYFIAETAVLCTKLSGLEERIGRMMRANAGCMENRKARKDMRKISEDMFYTLNDALILSMSRCKSLQNSAGILKTTQTEVWDYIAFLGTEAVHIWENMELYFEDQAYSSSDHFNMARNLLYNHLNLVITASKETGNPADTMDIYRFKIKFLSKIQRYNPLLIDDLINKEKRMAYEEMMGTALSVNMPHSGGEAIRLQDAINFARKGLEELDAAALKIKEKAYKQ